MDLHDRDQTGVQVIGLGFFGVQHLDWVGATRDGKNRSLVEILRELDSIQSGGRDDQLHVGALLYSLRSANVFYYDDDDEKTNQTAPERKKCVSQSPSEKAKYLLQEAEEHISVDGPLMSLIKHNDGVLA